MLGPIAVVIVSVLVFWVSEAPVSLIGILVFNAAALPTWLVLHLLQARLLFVLAYRRSPWMPPSLEVTQSREALDWDMRDPVYMVCTSRVLGNQMGSGGDRRIHACCVRLGTWGERLRVARWSVRRWSSSRLGRARRWLAPNGPLSDVERGLIPECAHVRSSRSPQRSPGGPLRHRA